MRKTYKCSNIKFCMEDDNQRRTWEYLQSITRKDGSYGKVLSDAFVTVLNGQMQIKEDKAEYSSVIWEEQSVDAFIDKLDKAMDKKFNEIFQEIQLALTEQINTGFKECVSACQSNANDNIRNTEDNRIEKKQETELSEDMMAFAFSMDG